jgi:hypothetical protein
MFRGRSYWAVHGSDKKNLFLIGALGHCNLSKTKYRYFQQSRQRERKRQRYKSFPVIDWRLSGARAKAGSVEQGWYQRRVPKLSKCGTRRKRTAKRSHRNIWRTSMMYSSLLRELYWHDRKILNFRLSWGSSPSPQGIFKNQNSNSMNFWTKA